MSELKQWITDPVSKWKEACARFKLLQELDRAGPDTERVAHSLGMTGLELRRLVSEGSTDLPVNDLLKALGLDPIALEHDDPAMMHDLTRVCALCADHDQCRSDLAAGTIKKHWREYCLNETSIDALREEAAGKA
jgi:hypothetical protein